MRQRDVDMFMKSNKFSRSAKLVEIICHRYVANPLKQPFQSILYYEMNAALKILVQGRRSGLA